MGFGSTGTKLIFAFVTLLIGIILVGVIAAQDQAITAKPYITDTVNIAAARIADSGGAFTEINTSKVFYLTRSTNPLAGATSNAPAWQQSTTEDCYTLGSAVVKNSTGATMTATTNYVYTAAGGAITFTNTPSINNTKSNLTTVTYSYCADGYMNQSFGRTMLDLVPGFFALVCLLVSVGLFFSVAKDYDLV